MKKKEYIDDGELGLGKVISFETRSRNYKIYDVCIYDDGSVSVEGFINNKSETFIAIGSEEFEKIVKAWQDIRKGLEE